MGVGAAPALDVTHSDPEHSGKRVEAAVQMALNHLAVQSGHGGCGPPPSSHLPPPADPQLNIRVRVAPATEQPFAGLHA